MTTPLLSNKDSGTRSDATATLYPTRTTEDVADAMPGNKSKEKEDGDATSPSTTQHRIRENWDQDRAKHIQFKGHGDKVVTCLQIDADKIVAGYDDQAIEVYDIRSGERLQELEGHRGGIWPLHFVGNTLVTGSTDQTVRVWDLEKGICTHVFRHHTGTVRCLQIVLPVNVNTDPKGVPRYEPEFPVIVSGSRDSNLAVWRLPDPERNGHLSPTDMEAWLLHSLSGHTQSVRDLVAEGSTLISGSYDTTVGVWNICTGVLVHRLHGHTGKVYVVALDRARNICMSGSMDSDIRVWSLEDGTCLHVLQGHGSLVGLLSWSPGSSHLVSASADETIRIWDPVLGVCLHTLTGHDTAISCVQSDGQKIISGADGGVKLWDYKTGKYIRDLLTDCLSVWQVKFDERRCVAVVKRRNPELTDVEVFSNDVWRHGDPELTYFEVLDYGVYGITEDVKDTSSTPEAIDSSLVDDSIDPSRKRKADDQLDGAHKHYDDVE